VCRLILIIGMLVTYAGLASCASTALQGYEGVARTDEETARIVVRRGRVRAEIISLQLPHGTMAVETTNVRVLPGENCIAVRAWPRFSESESSSAYMCFEAEAGETYELRVGTVLTYSDDAGYTEFGIDSFRLVNRFTREYVAIAARGTADCVSALVGQVARRGGMGVAGGRGRALECEDSE